MANMMLQKVVRRARSYSKRHHLTIEVQRVVKGRGKGLIDGVRQGESYWWTGSVVEVMAAYKNGIKIPHRKDKFLGIKNEKISEK
jgi:hypothetical protein